MTQPVALGTAITVFANSLIALLVILQVVTLTDVQVAAINLVIINAVVLITSAYAQMHSTSLAAPNIPAGTTVTVVQPGNTANTSVQV